MSTYSLPDLLHRWTQGDLTAEQAIGHVLQNLLTLAQRLNELEKPGALWARQLEQPPLKPNP